jgi:hypothetical protein
VTTEWQNCQVAAIENFANVSCTNTMAIADATHNCEFPLHDFVFNLSERRGNVASVWQESAFVQNDSFAQEEARHE